MDETFDVFIPLKAKPGKAKELIALVDKLASMVEPNEPQNLSYELMIDDETGTGMFHESYANEAGLAGHFGREELAPHVQKFFELIEPTQLLVAGNASDTLREALKPFGAVVLTTRRGYTKLHAHQH